MPNNKLKEKVNALTRVIGQMLKDLQEIDNLARGTLTAFQLHIGEEEWSKIMVIDENDFDEFRLIVAGQNSVELPDDSVSLIIRKFQEEARRLRNKMSGRGKPGDIEEQMISLSVATGIPLESIFDMTIRKFVKSVERLDLKIHYELYMGAVLGGFAKSDGKGVKHWLSSTDDKSNELISVDEFGAKVGGMPT